MKKFGNNFIETFYYKNKAYCLYFENQNKLFIEKIVILFISKFIDS